MIFFFRSWTLMSKERFFLTQTLLPLLAAEGASIVNIASDAGINGNYGCPLYCASKGAVVAFTKALALDLAPRVRVNCICPGDVATPMLGKQLQQADGSYTLEDVEQAYPLERVGGAAGDRACDLLGAVAVQQFYDGQYHSVDGGLTAK